MSACISSHGEYSAHEPDDESVCRLCGELDERSLREELARLRSTLPSVEDVARVLDEHRPIEDGRGAVIACGCGLRYGVQHPESEPHSIHRARAVLALLPGRTEAEARGYEAGYRRGYRDRSREKSFNPHQEETT